VQDPLPVWVAVGGTPQSVVRAGALGLPMALAIIGGQPERFVPFAELHRRAAEEYGHPAPALSINSHGFIADRSQDALDQAFVAHKVVMDKIGRERGWPPMTRAQFDAGATLHGANFVGSPQQVIEKVLFQHDLFGHERFLIQFSVGTMPHASIMRAIELFGTEVAPRGAQGDRAPERRGRVGGGVAGETTTMPDHLIDRALLEPVGAGGRFERQPSTFREWVSDDGSTRSRPRRVAITCTSRGPARGRTARSSAGG
jgi:hypothetical protein